VVAINLGADDRIVHRVWGPFVKREIWPADVRAFPDHHPVKVC
jgi:hypothetical protein